jgi:acetamidase/formamidase
VHSWFDASLPPAASVRPGELVVFDCPGLGLARDATVDDLLSLDADPESPHTIVGPVLLEGARAGDALVVDVVDVCVAADFGHCVIVPSYGLLPEFDETILRCLPFEDGYARLGAAARVPIEPFCGIMGVAPAAPGRHSSLPPRRVGGNLDIRHLTTGSSLTLPVEVDGALFSCGDGHAAQGDGEVCATAVETAVRATLRFSIVRQGAPPWPTFTTRGPVERRGAENGSIGTTATGPDVKACAQDAVRSLVTLLTTTRALARDDAYMLCSITADLRISQIVNRPNVTVSACLPLSVFA